MLTSYLSNRVQHVRVNQALSEPLPIVAGVPQGSILAPTLFQIFINDLLHLPKYLSCHAYADDTTFYTSSKDPLTLQTYLNHDINLIENWCLANHMVINTKKSHYLLVNPFSSSGINITIHGAPLQQKPTSKLLGFYINDKLNWSDHVQHIFSKMASNLRLFYNIRHLLNFHAAKQFYHNFIHSHLIYGLHIYYLLAPAKLTNPLFLLQERALRLICQHASIGKQKRSHQFPL